MLAKAVCQLTIINLIHRLREQARSHYKKGSPVESLVFKQMTYMFG